MADEHQAKDWVGEPGQERPAWMRHVRRYARPLGYLILLLVLGLLSWLGLV
jgi:hypothetical protein